MVFNKLMATAVADARFYILWQLPVAINQTVGGHLARWQQKNILISPPHMHNINFWNHLAIKGLTGLTEQLIVYYRDSRKKR